MSKLPDRCEDESGCSSTIVYQCSHHCKKMFCITHLVEHHQYIKERTQDRHQLQKLLDDYVEIFDIERPSNTSIYRVISAKQKGE